MLSRILCQAFRLCVVYLLAAGVTAGLAFAQSTGALTPSSSPTADWHFRFDLFQMLFEQQGLRPISDVGAAFRSPQRTVVVSLGKFHFVKESAVEQFLRDGGAMLLATDRPLVLKNVFSIQAGPAMAKMVTDTYQGHTDCIRLVDIETEHELSSGVRQLITNRSGWIDDISDPGDWRILARLPSQTTPSRSARQPIVASKVSGQLVVVADHSLFTNGMMWHGDNALLAINISNALCLNGRDQVLFLVDGVASSSYLLGPLAHELPLPQPPPDINPELNMDQMLQVANKVVAAVEDSNTFNKLLAGRPRGMPDSIYRRGLLYALSALLVGLTVYRLTAKSSKPTRPAAVPKPTRTAAKRNSRATKQVSPITRGEAAQKLAQHFCRQATSSDLLAVWNRDLSVYCKTSASLSRVVALAQQDKPPHLSEATLLDFAKEVAQLSVEFPQSKFQSSHVSRQSL